MVATQLISAYVPLEMKSRFRSLAEQQQITESALLKQLVAAAVRGDANIDADVLKSSIARVANIGPAASGRQAVTA